MFAPTKPAEPRPVSSRPTRIWLPWSIKPSHVADSSLPENCDARDRAWTTTQFARFVSGLSEENFDVDGTDLSITPASMGSIDVVVVLETDRSTGSQPLRGN